MFWKLTFMEINQSYSCIKKITAERSLEVVYVTVSCRLSEALCFRLLPLEQVDRTAQVENSHLLKYKITKSA